MPGSFARPRSLADATPWSGGYTWKEVIKDVRDGAGEACVAASGWGYREGIAKYAARHRRPNGTSRSNSHLASLSLSGGNQRNKSYSLASNAVTSA